jgi:hypothetical protein
VISEQRRRFFAILADRENHDSRLSVAASDPEKPLERDPSDHSHHKRIVVDTVKDLLQIYFHNKEGVRNIRTPLFK